MGGATLFRDDNSEYLSDVGGLRPDFTTIVKVSTGASITEQTIASTIAGNLSEHKQVILRVANTGTAACFFSLGNAATLPGANTAMITIAAGAIFNVKASAQDVSFYHQQITSSTTLEVSALV